MSLILAAASGMRHCAFSARSWRPSPCEPCALREGQDDVSKAQIFRRGDAQPSTA